jgi:hypothetical protein
MSLWFIGGGGRFRSFFGRQEVSGLELREWCWPRAVLIEGRPITEYERQSMCRAARSIGAVKVRRTWLGDS